MTFSLCQGWGLAWEVVPASSPAAPPGVGAQASRSSEPSRAAGPAQVGTARSPPTPAPYATLCSAAGSNYFNFYLWSIGKQALTQQWRLVYT